MEESALGEGFERIPSPVVSVGIYFLLKAGEVVFLAKSKSVYGKIAMHAAALSRHKRQKQSGSYHSPGDVRQMRIAFDEAFAFFCHEADLVRMELEFLERFRPKHNVIPTDTLPNVKVDIHALMAQIQWETKKTKTEAAAPIPRRSL